MAESIEGRWDDLAKREDLRGRKVRVIILDDTGKPEEDPWLRSFRAWANSHESVGHWVDDSRESIYSGTVDDPR